MPTRIVPRMLRCHRPKPAAASAAQGRGSRSGALASLAANIIGMGLGPTLTGYASDRFAERAFTGAGNFLAVCPGGKAPAGAAEALGQACDAAAAYGIRGALLCVSLLYAWAAIHYFLLGRTLGAESYKGA